MGIRGRQSAPGGHGSVRFAPLWIVVTLTILFGLVMSSALAIAGWFYLIPGGFANPQGDPQELFELLTITLAVTGGVGGAAALVVSLRRQRVSEAAHSIAVATGDREERRVLNERFNTAVRLLGDKDSVAVRLAGVAAIAGLADEWTEQQQVCIETLCGHFRLPYEAGNAPSGEGLVREAIINVIGDRLSFEAGAPWRSRSFDLRGAYFNGNRLLLCVLEKGTLDLTGALIGGEGLQFDRCVFVESTVNVSQVSLDDEATLAFEWCDFRDSITTADDLVLESGTVDFSNSRVNGGSHSFRRLQLRGGLVKFDGVSFATTESFYDPNNSRLVGFEDAELRSGKLSFRGAEFSYGSYSTASRSPGWYHAAGSPVIWPSALIDFSKSVLDGAEVDFIGAKFWSGIVRAYSLSVKSGTMTFQFCKFHGHLVFHQSHMEGGVLDFSQATISSEETIDQAGRPAWLMKMFEQAGAQRTDYVYYPMQTKPNAQIDFTDSELSGGSIAFDQIDGKNGMIDFKGCRFKGPAKITFRAFHGRLVTVFWRIHPYSNEHRVEFDTNIPYVLISYESEEDYTQFFQKQIYFPDAKNGQVDTASVMRHRLSPEKRYERLDLEGKRIFAVNGAD